MRKRRKIESRYYILIVFIIGILLVGGLMYAISDQRTLSPIEKVIKDTVLSVQKILIAPFNFFKGEEVESSKTVEAKNKELESQLEEMKNLLELNQTLGETQRWNATVVTRNIDSWYQTFTIDKGSSSGITVGMAVVNSQGLLGKVIHTSYFYSTVKLLTSVDSTHKVSVKIASGDQFIYGLLSEYDEKKKQYKIEGIAENTNIELGTNVITTGLGDDSPAGILIGTVASIETDHFDLARTVFVKPSVDFDQFRYVSVVKRGVLEK